MIVYRKKIVLFFSKISLEIVQKFGFIARYLSLDENAPKISTGQNSTETMCILKSRFFLQTFSRLLIDLSCIGSNKTIFSCELRCYDYQTRLTQDVSTKYTASNPCI